MMKAATAKTRSRFENILFATDFSAAAAHAVPYIKKIAKHYQSNLVALHVRPPLTNPVNVPGTWPTDTEAVKADDRKHHKEILQTFAGIPTRVRIEEGDIQTCLDAAIRDDNIDLLLIGTRGRTGLGKLVLGSIAEEIFRTVTCPVLTVGPHSGASTIPKEEFREILYATDFSPESHRAAACAVCLAQEFQARLILVHAVPEAKAGDLVSWSDVQASSKALLHKLVPPEAEVWCKPEYFVEHGDPAERILDLANLREMDLIVLGVHPAQGVPGAATHLPIATAHKVVSRATCPVLTVRGWPWSEPLARSHGEPAQQDKGRQMTQRRRTCTGGFMKPYRDIAILVALQLLCLLLLTHFEPDFFLIHLYESILYIAIWVLLFYMEDRWAYMIGILASVVWLGLAYEAGILSRGFNLFRGGFGTGGLTGDPVRLIALTTMLLAVLMIVFCGRHWIKEYSGLGKTRSTFFVSFGIVGVYYAILLHWFWDMIPNS